MRSRTHLEVGGESVQAASSRSLNKLPHRLTKFSKINTGSVHSRSSERVVRRGPFRSTISRRSTQVDSVRAAAMVEALCLHWRYPVWAHRSNWMRSAANEVVSAIR